MRSSSVIVLSDLIERGGNMIIGLTGSIASGKSTVSAMLAEKGYPIVDADKIARLVVEPGTPVIQKIKETFGEEVLQKDGALNREELGKRIFGHDKNRELLNAIIHPAIRAEMLHQKETHLANGANTIIMDIPLLFESKLQSFVEKIIVVTVNPTIQQERLMKRNGFTEDEAMSRIASQLPLSVKEDGADAVIDNNGSIEETARQLNEVLKRWRI